jgi:rod shape-determining protein MreC
MKKLLAFLHRHRYATLFLLLLALALAMLLSRRSTAPGSGVLPATVLELFGPFQKGLEKGIRFFTGAWERYIYLVDLEEENRMLREIVLELKKETYELTEERLENRRLRSLIGFKQSVPKPLLPAQVIGKDLTGWFQTLTIDRGRQDGIEEGMAVLSVQGIVGQIMEVSGNFARVLLITDPNSAVAAMVQRTRARGIVEGKGFKGCTLKYVHRSENIAREDRVLSSGLDGVYPKGTMVGTVSHVRKRETELFQEVEVHPSVDFNKLEEVIVVCEKAFQDTASKEISDR